MNKKNSHLVMTLGLVLSLFTSLFSFQPARATGVLFASPTGADSGTCNSWAAACTLQYALSTAVSGDEIWVKQGVHKPTVDSGDRNATFALKNGVAIYGGFTGTETSLNQRNAFSNVTILSGDIDGNDTLDENGISITLNGSNSYHVVTGVAVDNTSVLDGFTITGGQADGASFPNDRGGGMYNNDGSPTLTGLYFRHNTAAFGGGMYNRTYSDPIMTEVYFWSNTTSGNGGGMYNDVYSDPSLHYVFFLDNTADDNGGGMYNNNNSEPILTNTFFISGNTATNGGGMYNDESNPTLTNVVFNTNMATANGGGMFNLDSNPILTNVTVSKNNAVANGGGMYNSGSNPEIHNSIMWGNTAPTGSQVRNILSSTPTFSYSDIQDCGGSVSWVGICGADGSGNIDADPLFVDAITGDLRLQVTSPAIDAGNNAAPKLSGITLDANSDPRFVDVPSVPDTGNGTAPIVDMGAFELYYGEHLFTSIASQDGWILESSETSNKGGKLNKGASTLNVGDDAANKQYRAVLSFGTAVLPDNAVVTKVTLKVKRQGVTGGGNPITTFKGFMVDVKKGNFGTSALQLTDFQTKGDKTISGLKPKPVNGWYTMNLTGAKTQINLTGNTQIRLRFKLDDNNNFAANFLKLYSGNASGANKPQLIVEYYLGAYAP
jgi:hypothetical protein